MIGHPYGFNLDWQHAGVDVGGGTFVRVLDLDNTQATAIMSSAKWEYNGGSYLMCDPRGVCGAPEDPMLGSFDGFWVKAFTNTTLRIPASPSGRGATGPGHSVGEWYLRLSAESEDGMTDPSTVLGCMSNADDGQDSLDVEEPSPQGNNFMVLAFPHPEWGGDEWAFATDFRDLEYQSGDSWDFELRTNQARTVTLRWELGGNDTGILADSTIRDLESGTSIDPSKQSEYSFEAEAPVHRFTLQVAGRPGLIFADGFDSGDIAAWTE